MNASVVGQRGPEAQAALPARVTPATAMERAMAELCRDREARIALMPALRLAQRVLEG